MINDTSQRSVAIWFGCDGTFDPYLIINVYTAESVLREFLKLFNIWQSFFWEIRLPQVKSSVRRALSCWKM